MAASSSSSCMIMISLLTSNKSHVLYHQLPLTPTHKHVKCSLLRRRRRNEKESSNRYLVVSNATPEAAGDLLSSLSHPVDNPWIAGVAGLLLTVPLLIQRLIALSKGVDMAAQTMEDIADAVGKVAEEVDKAAENLGESLPEGGLKKMVELVEDIAEETTKDAQMVEDLMDKVGQLDDKLEELLKKPSKGSENA